MRGELQITRKKEGGTKIHVRVPATVSYRAESRSSLPRWNLFRRTSRKIDELAKEFDQESDEPLFSPNNHS